jgi:glycosyltransferase involved in cell wall biosynthesis
MDAIEEGVSGLLVAEGDTRAMAAAMLKLSEEPGLAARMGAAGRSKAERFYTWPAERARLLGHHGLEDAASMRRLTIDAGTQSRL